jgi:Group II intron, maturase-specific domain
MYDRHVVRKRTFQTVDYHIWRALWRWAKRRAPQEIAAVDLPPLLRSRKVRRHSLCGESG